MTDTATRGEIKARGIWALQAVNFFVADMQAGIGPFLGVFLLAHGWATGWIGSVVTIGGIAGVLVTTPAGALVDHTKHKRAYVIVSGVCAVLASAIVLRSQDFWLVAASQVAAALAGAAIVPALTGITLGMVRQRGFLRQSGRNQAFNHAGSVVGAALSGVLASRYGFAAVFYLAGAFGAATVAAVLVIPKRAIDNRAARGMKDEAGDDNTVSGVHVLVTCRPLLILAAALLFFHLGNGALLSLYGLAIVSAKEGNPATLVATTVIVSQATMVVAALAAPRLVERTTYWHVILISFLALPARGILAALLIKSWGIFPVQILDGVGAGLQSAVVPGLVARLMHGTGRINVGQGAVLTVQSLGASVSPALGGWIAQWLGFAPTFVLLSSLSIGSLAVWLTFRERMERAAGGPEDRDQAAGTPVPAAAE